MELVVPDIRYKDSFIAARLEDRPFPWTTRGEDGINYSIAETNFETFVTQVLGRAQGKYLPEGFVPDSQYWLVDSGEYVGHLSIRHELNEHLRNIGGHIGYNIRPSKRRMGYGKEILRLGLLKAKELGIDRVLLTCDETNTGSRKIIEANRGEFENFYEVGEGKPRKLRYWISV